MAAGGITGGAAKPRLDELDRRVDCPRVTQLDRFAQGWQPDRNPLQRTSDRAETALLAVLFIAFFAAAPFVVQACGTMAHAAAHRVQLAEQASWHQVSPPSCCTRRPAQFLTQGFRRRCRPGGRHQTARR